MGVWYSRVASTGEIFFALMASATAIVQSATLHAQVGALDVLVAE